MTLIFQLLAKQPKLVRVFTHTNHRIKIRLKTNTPHTRECRLHHSLEKPACSQNRIRFWKG